MNDDINDYLPSILNPRTVRKSGNLTLTQNSVVSRRSLSLRKQKKVDKENNPHTRNQVQNQIQKQSQNILLSPLQEIRKSKIVEDKSIGFSGIEDLITTKSSRKKHTNSSLFSLDDYEISATGNYNKRKSESLRSVSSATEIVYELNKKPMISVSLGVIDCDIVDLSTSNINIKRITVTRDNNGTNIDCDMIESEFTSTSLSSETKEDEPTPPKRSVAVKLEIKKNNVHDDTTENSKVLILNTNAIERLSHVVVQPPNYKLEKQSGKLKISDKKRKPSNINRKRKSPKNLKQSQIDNFFRKSTDVINVSESLRRSQTEHVVSGNGEVMSKNISTWDTGKGDRVVRPSASKKHEDVLLKTSKLCKGQKFKPTLKRSAVSNPESQNSKDNANIPNKNLVLLHFNMPKSTSHKITTSSKLVPYYKMISGTNFAVDAFSYGDLPNVNYYFLTHFHSDHYSGLKKQFDKIVLCSKISAQLCISRLGINPNKITILNLDETILIDGVQVTAVDANHCPGAIMLIFTLASGRTMLHTGDFRAAFVMESYPVFWNKDIHTVYLDTTYCNPRYDFPTQDQSLEMALYHLRQKKAALEKVGKSFMNVLIVCGTYTIGKEKFFLGMARRVGCSVWACPEKDRVLQVVEGRSFGHSTPQSCQIHVVPMRDLTHDKLRSYLHSLDGAFTEVVAFKPSGWESGKECAPERDNVTIHGIPYSEHSSFSELIRFVKFLRPKFVVPTVEISGGAKSVQKYFPCPLLGKDELLTQNRLTDYFSIKEVNQSTAVT